MMFANSGKKNEKNGVVFHREQPAVVWCLLPKEHYIAFIILITVGRAAKGRVDFCSYHGRHTKEKVLSLFPFIISRRAGACSRRKQTEKDNTNKRISLLFICKSLSLSAGASPRPTGNNDFCGSIVAGAEANAAFGRQPYSESSYIHGLFSHCSQMS